MIAQTHTLWSLEPHTCSLLLIACLKYIKNITMCPHDSRSMSMTVYCSSSFFVSSSHGPDTGYIQTRNWKWDIISLDPHSYILHTPAHERVQNVNRKTVIIMAKHWFNMTNDNRWNMEISIYMLHKMHSTNMTRRTIRCIDNFPILCLFFYSFLFLSSQWAAMSGIRTAYTGILLAELSMCVCC